MLSTLYRTFLATSKKARLEKAERKLHRYAAKRQELKFKAMAAQKQYEEILKEE